MKLKIAVFAPMPSVKREDWCVGGYAERQGMRLAAGFPQIHRAKHADYREAIGNTIYRLV
jgi:hypothetical protein